MYQQISKPRGNKRQKESKAASQKQNSGESAFQLKDRRPEVIVQRKVQKTANNSPKVS